ncbi:hypothetical protein OPIT5_12355 [Opitutaceae bacterium TAV5]|nr:hypothetical protein OPIT5_12355 [Opitutaceae bacterium TAV5]
MVAAIGLLSASPGSVAATAAESVTSVTNHLQNGDFESAATSVAPWRWATSGGAQASGEPDSETRFSGHRSFRITNATPRAPDVYGGLRQIVKGLKPDTAYQVRLWVKGENVSSAVLVCGVRWDKRMNLPRGTYGWRRVVFDLETGSSPGDFNVIVIADSTVGALWVDDIELVETAEVEAVEGPIERTGLRNGGFDQPGLAWWDWSLAGKPAPEASGDLDASVKRSGRHSFRITNQTPETRNTYGRLRQLVDGLEPGRKYRLRMWIKGQSVSKCVVALGEGWKMRKNIPARTYDWQEFSFDFTTDRKTAFQVIVIAAGPTQALWIDDVEIIALDDVHQTATVPRISPPAVWDNLAPSLAFYPVFQHALASASAPPLTLLPDKAGRDGSGGGTVRITHDTLGLHFVFDASGQHRGEVIDGESMWRGDSVQVAIDLKTAERPDGSTAPWYEIGFALLPAGKVGIHAWRTGQDPDFDYASIAATTTGVRTESGYRITTTIPWHVLKVDARNPPPVLGLNVVFNSEGEGGVRQAAEWTPGIAHEKNPAAFAIALLEQSRMPSVALLRLDKTTHDAGERVSGTLIEYAHQALVSEKVVLGARRVTSEPAEAAGSARGEDPVVVGEVVLPAVAQGEARSVFFSAGNAQFDRQGAWQVFARKAGGRDVTRTATPVLAEADLRRINMRDRLAGLFETVKARHEKTGKPGQRDDLYFNAGDSIAGHFLRRLSGEQEEHHFEKNKEWSLLQLEEVQAILDELEERNRESIAAMSSQQGKGEMPSPAVGKTGISDGVLVRTTDGIPDASRPSFFNGFGHFDAVARDLPFLAGIGARLIQQERGPSDLLADGRPGPGVDSIVKTLREAESTGVMVDLLLSPHYFPRRVLDAHPDIRLRSADSKGFIRFNIDHPEARRVIEQWLRTIVPAVKDSAALFGLCISNEPAYVFSGKDAHSRPQWIAWLRKRHKSIGSLNTLYGTSWRDFDEVPVPALTMPEGVEARRAFYDWVRFNQVNFAAWHQWMANVIREMAPDVLLHAKLMPVMLERSRLVDGIDAELFAEFTDIAGNDVSSYFESRYGYAFAWQRQQMWYDLLHSFRGQPVFNSENHFIPDGFPARHVPPEHTRTVIWQGGLHHQWATALWVWEQPRTPALSGSIWLRPANTFAAAGTMLDMNRLAPAFAAVNQAKAEVALLYSMPSTFWNPDYIDALTSAYTALTFMGKKVTFISERQLAGGIRSPANAYARRIVVSHATHVSADAVRGLETFVRDGGQLVAVGPGNLAYDEYARPQSLPKIFDEQIVRVGGEGSDERLMHALRDAFGGGSNEADKTGLRSETGALAWGIEYRIVRTPDGFLVPLTNLLREPQVVRLSLEGSARDLVSGKPVDPGRIELLPMTPVFLKIE